MLQQSFICIMDILGTKGSWDEKFIEKYFETLESSKNEFHSMRVQLIPDTSEFPIAVDYLTFSDSIVVTLQCKLYNEGFFDNIAPAFNRIILGIFQKFMSNQFLLRGAISYGMMDKRGSHFVGPAVDDAAEYCDLQEMIGICLTPKASLLMEDLIDWHKRSQQVNSYVIKYNTPLKGNLLYELYQIDWPAHFFTSDVYDKQHGSISRLSQFITGKSIPPNAIQKIKNTLTYYNYCSEKYL